MNIRLAAWSGRVKEQGQDNDLLQRLGEDSRIPFSTTELEAMVADHSRFVGRAPEQTEEFLSEKVEPVLKRYQRLIGQVDAEITV